MNAIRVIPYLQGYQIFLFIAAVIFLLVSTISIVQIKWGLRDNKKAIDLLIEAISVIKDAKIVENNSIQPNDKQELSPIPEPTSDGEVREIHVGFEEVGPITNREWDLFRIYGREALIRSRKSK